MRSSTQPSYIIRLHLNDRELGRWTLDERPLEIGRATDNEIVLENLTISRHHARIEMGPDGPVIRDLESRNGLRVDGVSCQEAPLSDGTVVEIGRHILRCETAATRAEVEDDAPGKSPAIAPMPT